MSRRLQIAIDEDEHARIRQVARREEMTVSEWARRALQAAAAQEQSSDVDNKLAIIHAAARHAAPTANIDQMLAEIDRHRS